MKDVRGLLRNEKWIETVFVFATGYKRQDAEKQHFIIFFFSVGQAKLAVYESRENQIEKFSRVDLLSLMS